MSAPGDDLEEVVLGERPNHLPTCHGQEVAGEARHLREVRRAEEDRLSPLAESHEHPADHPLAHRVEARHGLVDEEDGRVRE